LASARAAVELDVKLATFPVFHPAPEPMPMPASPPPSAALPPSPPPRVGVERPRASSDDLAALRELGHAEGFAAGVAEGRAAAFAEWSERLGAVAAALDGAARELLSRRVELAAEVDRQLPRAVFSLCRRILHAELSTTDTATRTIIRSLSGRLAGVDGAIAIRVSPQMLEAFEAWRRSAAGAHSAAAAFRTAPDPGLGPGEWLLETRDGFLDGRIESQLEEAWKLVAELTP
jgi:flagellar assembly protein FliH